ncbi:MAG: signal recognition particle-docking protein FtsY, partial [Sinobacteraceae bacterium]|nr:signal recognition particle-docking protein FtsY [Nevskiaceae bacterium]
ALQFHEAIGLTGIAMTKLDGTAKGGVLLAIAKRLALPIRFIGVGEGIEDLEAFDADAYVQALIGS